MRRYLWLPVCLVLSCNHSEPQGNTADDPPPPPLAIVKDTPQKALPPNAEMERLAASDPIAFLQNCVRHYDRTVQGYRLVMRKKERIGNKEHPAELVEVCFREQPYSVYLNWLEGARRAQKALYVEGENDGKILVRPTFGARLVGYVRRDPDSEDARQSGRYSMKEYGLKKAMLRLLGSWEAAKKDGALHVELLGEQKPEETGGRACWVLKRSRYKRPERDGVTETTVYIDKETWLLVGSTLRGEGGRLVADYWFRDIELNPTFKENQFTKAVLTETNRAGR